MQSGNPFTEELSQGVGNSPADPQFEQRYRESKPETLDWTVARGSVVLSLPQYGWHYVLLEGKAGVVSAQLAGQADSWGTQSVRALQAGSSVLVAHQYASNDCIIVGQVTPEITEPETQFVETSAYGSWSGINRDPANRQYLETTARESEVAVYDINPLWDQHAGDWGVRTNTGVMVLADPLGIRLAADDVTEIAIDLLQQQVNISGRGIELRSDAMHLQSSPAYHESIVGLGQYGYRHADTEEDPIRFVPASDADKSLGDWTIHVADGDLQKASLLTFAYTRVLVGPNNLHCETDLSVAHQQYDRGHRIISGDSTILSRDIPAHIEHRDRIVEAEEQATGPLEVMKTLAESLEDEQTFVSSHLRELADFAKAVVANSELGESADNNPFNVQVSKQELVLNPSYLIAGPTNKYEELVDENESVVAVAPGGELPKGRVAEEVRDMLESIISVDRQTGEIAIINEQGAGIRIIGNAVYIEGTQIRMAATKDVVTIARDIHTSAQRNIQYAANKNIRIFGTRNVSVLGGIEGVGGVLIEGRGTTADNELPTNPEDADYAGVTIKALRSYVATLGGDVITKAGDSEKGIAGKVAVYCDTGDITLAASNRVINFARSSVVHAFGNTPAAVRAVAVHGQNTTLLPGSLYATSMWSNSSIIARSTVQAVTGHMASRQGGPLGVIRNPEPLIKSLDALNAGLQSVRQSTTEDLAEVVEAHTAEKRVANSQTFVEISTGYPVKPSGNPYGVKTIVAPLQQLYEQSQAPTEDFKIQAVKYKPDATTSGLETKAWPGDNSKPVGVRTSGDASISRVLKAAKNGEVEWAALDEEERTVAKTIRIHRTLGSE